MRTPACAVEGFFFSECVDQSVQPALSTFQVHLDRSEVSVEPTIKFPGDYHAEETSVAAANLASYMQVCVHFVCVCVCVCVCV